VATTNGTVRLAAMSDLHVSKTGQGALSSAFAQVSERADLLVLCGDLTDYGLPEEARVLARDIGIGLRVPCVAVLGNHDFEAGKQDEVRQILTDAGVTVLDGDSCELLGPWGEEIIKSFVREAVNEAFKLESALARLRSPHRVALLHYSPVRSTVEGEPLEIFPYLGSSRLEEPLARYPVTAVVHGHAHNGCLEGRTASGTPVYNVAMPLLKKCWPEQPPFRVIEIGA
jgi:Icc-related predicted phosphoesterase